MSYPLVSVLIPTYNRVKYLEETIKSVLKQSYSNIEIIISDNNSNDKTDCLCLDFSQNNIPGKIRYFRNEFNIGAILNWKKAYSYAKGKYIILIPDDDMLIDEEYIAKCVDFLESHVDAMFVTARVRFDSMTNAHISSEITTIRGCAFLENFGRDGNFIPTISNVFRANIIKMHHFWTDPACFYSDIELWLKLLMNGNIAVLNSEAVFYRRHSTNIVFNMSKEDFISTASFIPRLRAYSEEMKYKLPPLFIIKISLWYLIFIYQLNKSSWQNIDFISVAKMVVHKNKLPKTVFIIFCIFLINENIRVSH